MPEAVPACSPAHQGKDSTNLNPLEAFRGPLRFRSKPKPAHTRKRRLLATAGHG